MLFLVLAVGGDIVWHRKGVSHWGGSLVQGTGQLYSSWSLLDPEQNRNKLQFLLWHEGRGAASTALPVAELPSFIQCWCCWTWIAPQNLLLSRRMPGWGSAWGLQEPWDPSCLCSPRAERGGLSCATRVWQCHIPAELGHTRSCLESWQGRIREL